MVVIATHTGYVFDPDSYAVWQPASRATMLLFTI